MRLLLLLLGIPTIACGDVAPIDEEPIDGLAHDFAFEVGTHAPNAHRPQSLHIIADRSSLDVVTGPQGLNMIILVPRVLEPVTEPLTLVAQLESGPSLAGEVSLQLPPASHEDDALVVHDVFLRFATLTVSPDDYARLRVVLTDATGKTSELRKTVRLHIND